MLIDGVKTTKFARLYSESYIRSAQVFRTSNSHRKILA